MKTVQMFLRKIVVFRWPVPVASLLFISLLVLLTSCGYHFTSIGGIIPQGTRTIAIPVFINDTTEPYVDVEVTKAVVEEFLTDGRLKVESLDTADLILRGRVTSFNLTPQAYTADTHVQSYNVGIGVSVSIEDARTQKLVLKDAAFSSVFTSSYAVTLGDISQTKIAKDAAIQSACKDLASTLRSRVLEGF
jgi:outer membrane lipopolysaccharide assembly protein LptE/RlpB